MKTLSEVTDLLRKRGSLRSSTLSPARVLNLDDDANLLLEGRALPMAPEAEKYLAGLAGVPYPFFAESPADVKQYLFNRFWPETKEVKGDVQLRLILEDENRVVGVTESDLAYLPAADVLEAALAAKPDDIEEKELLVPFYLLNGSFRISIVSPSRQRDIRVDDPVRAGIDICYSDIGGAGTRIESYIHRLKCENGIVAKVCRHVSEAPRRIRRAGTGNEDLIRRRVSEVAQVAWQELEMKMKAMKVLAGEETDSPAALIRALGERLRLPERLVNEIIAAIDADEVGPSGTLWDVVNAVSRVGTHAVRLSAATRRYLLEISGELIAERVERCPSCGRLSSGRMRFLPRR